MRFTGTGFTVRVTGAERAARIECISRVHNAQRMNARRQSLDVEIGRAIPLQSDVCRRVVPSKSWTDAGRNMAMRRRNSDHDVRSQRICNGRLANELNRCIERVDDVVHRRRRLVAGGIDNRDA